MKAGENFARLTFDPTIDPCSERAQNGYGKAKQSQPIFVLFCLPARLGSRQRKPRIKDWKQHRRIGSDAKTKYKGGQVGCLALLCVSCGGKLEKLSDFNIGDCKSISCYDFAKGRRFFKGEGG